MASYPGQRSRRGMLAALLAVLVALGAGVAVGWAAFGRDTSAANSHVPPCPGGQHDTSQRARAAACLLDAYLALANQPPSTWNAQLADIVLPGLVSTFRRDYRPVAGEFAQHSKVYAAVAAVKPDQEGRASGDVPYWAWVATSVNTAPPRTVWYLGDFAVRWQRGRWWLSAAFAYDSTVPNWVMPSDARAQFGPGWVGV